MSRSLVVGSFENGEDILSAARAARVEGLTIVDTYTPYAVHGLDTAMGLAPSRLSWVCLVAGLTGAILKLWFEWWTAVVDWPVNVGGKPDNSLPAFVPITFEVMVLFAGLATVGALFAVARLWPGRRRPALVPRTTDDRFALVIEQTSAEETTARVRALFEQHRAVAVTEHVDEGRTCGRRQAAMKALNVMLALALLAAIGANAALDRDPAIPARDYLPEMTYSLAAESYAADPAFGSGGVLQVPPDGTIARGASPLHYLATPADALRAGLELSAPPIDLQALRRGATLFQTFCATCHGDTGLGNGPVVARGFPPPVSLLAPHARDMKDGQIFHVLTYGQLNMPPYASQIDAVDRWRIVAYVRQLQGSQQP